MKRKLSSLVALVGGMTASSTVFAEEAAAAASAGGSSGLLAIGSGLAIGLAALGGTLGQAKAAGAALEGIARNPGSRNQVFMPLVLSLALIEFQAILGFVIAFMWLGK